MNWIYRDVTVLSLISAFATAPAFSQALAQPSDPPGAIGAAGQAINDEAAEALEAAGRNLTPPAYYPPASVIPRTPATGEPASPYPAQPPYWYFDRPAAPLSPYSGQPYGYALQSGEPVLPFATMSYAYAAEPAAPVAYATRPYGNDN
jgi:hypothetical protein